MFSERISWDQQPNKLGRLLQEKRSRGEVLIDLTESNPTRVGLEYPAGSILEAIAPAGALGYAPDPRGLAQARRAIARYYEGQGVGIDPQALFLTASTSEAYGLLFKLLANPGDEILIPRPGYPLLAYLAAFEGLTACAYPMRCAGGGWSIDLDVLQALVSPRTRAIVLVNPNNPTGSYVASDELAAIDEICRRHDLAMIVDEVFSDFAAQPEPETARSVLKRTAALTFVLNGFSKMMALPQLKLAWIAVSGEHEFSAAAQAHLETLLDFYLSVGTPVQLAVSRLLEGRITIQGQILRRLESNGRYLQMQVDRCADCRMLPRQGGWYAVVEIRDMLSDEERSLQLLDRDNILVHPGYFYDFNREGYLVVSLLPQVELFRAGIDRLVRRCGCESANG